MPTRPLGLTGHNVKLFSLGGQATLEKPGKKTEAEAIINRALDLGVNYIDTAAAYGGGISQTYIGGVMATRRSEVFLASKTHDRTRAGSLALLDQSLTSLQTDYLDLWQIHNIQTIGQLDTVFGPGGAIEALEEAKADGRARFLGITGHFDPEVLIRGISRYPFDAILMALNPADPHNSPFAEKLLPLANQKQMGVIAMKIPGRGRIFRAGGITSMSEAMGYVLSLPVSTVIIGCDTIAQLDLGERRRDGFRDAVGGMAVSLIQSNASGFGSWLAEPNTGINLHNRGLGFSLDPGHPAEFGPGRRPPHTLSPALATRDDDLVSVFGTMGGDAQPQILLQIAARLFHHGHSPAAAINAPRWALAGPGTGFDTWAAPEGPNVELEGHVSDAWRTGLATRGHRTSLLPAYGSGFGHAHAIVLGADGVLAGAADPRARVSSVAAR